MFSILNPIKQYQKGGNMKSLMKHLALALMVAILFTSCAKQPTQELNNAKAAIDAVVAEKGDVYAPDELKKLNDDLQATNDEITAQSKKFFKKYGKAKEMLVKLVADADAVKVLIPARIEEAKNNALTAQNEAKAAVDEAKALLAKAPKGKGTKADIEAMKADLTAAETALAEIQTAIDAQDYFGAKDKAVSIKDKAAAISEQVKQAIEKVKGKKK
jgi:predicted SnoaL-like aldol condensation-catalyzing enzyme